MMTPRQAIEIYLDEAYGSEPVTQSVLAFLKELEPQLDDAAALMANPELEHPQPDMVALRLGNTDYPHMKLVMRSTKEGLVFSVDTHDGPERIPPTLPGYERFQQIIERNARIRNRIQRRLAGWNITDAASGDATTEQNRGDILVVDDEPFIGEIMGRLLRSLAFRVHYASSARDGQRLAGKLKFRCCFLDIMMPGKSGYEFLEELEDKGLRTFPIVFVTGMHPDNIRKELADDVILKPFTRSMLAERLRRFGLL